MCELFGMSARCPTRVQVSLERFASHGEPTDRNRDGWGVAFYEGLDARVVKEAAPAGSSERVRFIENHDLGSTLVVAHIRAASRGEVAYVNTHPFTRELGGRTHVFAHNGGLRHLDELQGPPGSTPCHRPIGGTDSEEAFCRLLSRMEPLWPRPGAGPTLEDRLEVVKGFAAALRERGVANFLYSDGEFLFAHAHHRTDDEGRTGTPGLHLHGRSCPAGECEFCGAGVTIDRGHLDAGTVEAQEVVLIASVPLVGQGWTAMREGEIAVLRDGSLERIEGP